MARKPRKKPKYHQGKFKPRNPQKYLGDPANIIYRSGLEFDLFTMIDKRESILKWASEEFYIPYISPLTGERRRYFVDVYLEYVATDGKVEKAIAEIKPSVYFRYNKRLGLYTAVKPKQPKRLTEAFRQRCETSIINQAKWAAAQKWAKSHNLKFFIFSEKDVPGG